MSSARSDFYEEINSLYRNLYDLIYLRNCPIAEVLVPDPSLSRKARGWQLHHLLLDAIEELNPGAGAPILTREWRRHQLLLLRFVEMLDPNEVANDLCISPRQYFREQKAALQTLADVLWNRCVQDPEAQADMPAPPSEQSVQQMQLLRLETARIQQASRSANPGEVVRGILPLLQELMKQHGITMHPTIPEQLPAASMNRSLLRQMLLGSLSLLVENSTNAQIHLNLDQATKSIRICATVNPPDAFRASEQTRMRTAELEEMAALGKGRIAPLHAAGIIAGFEMQLPVAQRTLLAVDDNRDVLELYSRYVEDSGYQIITAPDAETALELARSANPQVITLDLMMPNQDGWELLQLLSNQPETSHIPVIICSVLKQQALALSLGAVAFLEKPVSRQALLGALHDLEQPQQSH